MALRSSAEMFDEAERIEQQLQSDFDRYDRRQELFRKKFATETRRQNQSICDSAFTASASSSNAAAVLGRDREDKQDDANDTKQGNRRSSKASNAVNWRVVREKDKHPEIFRALACFYNPPDAATDVVCELCYGYRSALMVQPLPPPWEEHCDETSGKSYFYDPSTKQVLWHPPPDADQLSTLVFERTNSAFTLCHCIPSNERRRRLMQKFREHAMQMARAEAEKRDRNLRGAFITLAMSLVPGHNQKKL
ncbi:hypothetical protein PHYBOEH_000549 [Phytophthora boehmeriae]|uniref:WW domain-containing protein n=1 Tax=Phytophthora boehmeriae TaxID=109152 RepID=A0A8T1WVS0_9STRA|nr:hypothetical protein PHYBOEH_000549 [Phytophthora boehmeriae]